MPARGAATARREAEEGRQMPTNIGREDVQRLVAEGVVLVEALPPESYAERHLPGAINLPLRTVDRRVRDVLDPGRPVVVYCYDSA
jgi:rhodanese-related sulfurtransferase